MPKPQFQKVAVECWRCEERLGSSRSSVCFFHATAAPCLPLVAALDELTNEGPPASRLLTLRPCRRDHAVSTLRWRVVEECSDLRVMHIGHDEDVVTIEMTMIGLAIIRKGFVAWGEGGEDFGVGPHHSDFKQRELGVRDLQSVELWFWGPYYHAP